MSPVFFLKSCFAITEDKPTLSKSVETSLSFTMLIDLSFPFESLTITVVFKLGLLDLALTVITSAVVSAFLISFILMLFILSSALAAWKSAFSDKSPKDLVDFSCNMSSGFLYLSLQFSCLKSLA